MYRFRLQTVLEVRERLARLRQKVFSEALLRQQQWENQVAQNNERIQRSSEQSDRIRQESASAFPLELYANFRRRLLSENQRWGEQMREHRQELEAKRKAMVEAKRAHRSLEILRDKAVERHQHEQEQRERSTMDEVASIFHLLETRRK